MVRGGRAWPSERKLGAGAAREGNEASVNTIGSLMPADALGMGGTEQEAEHMLHFCDLWSWSELDWLPWS